MPEQMTPSSSQIAQRQNIDQYSRFLKPTIPAGQLDYYNPRMPLVSKELSIGNIQREDMIAYLDTEQAILEFLEEGQIGLARFMMTTFQSELKLSMSFDGLFMEYIATNKFEYTQTQHLHEHQDRPKKGFLGIGGKS